MPIFAKKAPEAPASPQEGLPRHVAVIMDGNRRWAKARNLPVSAGHAAGAEAFRRIANYSKAIGLKYLTVYAFSTENWKRSPGEVDGIMRLLERYLREIIADMEKNRVRFFFFGDLSVLSEGLRALCDAAAERSRRYDGVQVNFCINYGSRDEIVRAARDFADACVRGEETPDALTEERFARGLYSADVPDPDLLIRPGGEVRISNFLLWQCAYAEFYFTDVLWPDFDERELDRAIEVYRGRQRRYGGA